MFLNDQSLGGEEDQAAYATGQTPKWTRLEAVE
jgi:hypothetical protein